MVVKNPKFKGCGLGERKAGKYPQELKCNRPSNAPEQDTHHQADRSNELESIDLWFAFSTIKNSDNLWSSYRPLKQVWRRANPMGQRNYENCLSSPLTLKWDTMWHPNNFTGFVTPLIWNGDNLDTGWPGVGHEGIPASSLIHSLHLSGLFIGHDWGIKTSCQSEILRSWLWLFSLSVSSLEQWVQKSKM